jgi:ABC-2 type transport system permease protein
VNRVIIEVTLRQLVGRRRTLLMALLALIPVGLALLFRANAEGERPDEFTVDMLNVIVISALLPLIALIFGTAALGAEIEDGTAVYLLAKPLPRPTIIVSKLVVAFLITAVMVVPATLVSSLIVLDGFDSTRLVAAFTLAVLAGSLVYTCLFMMLSVMTSRALIAGLVYVFLWEGLVAGLFRGVRVFSVRQYTLGIADAITTVRRSVFEARLGGAEALILAVVVAVAATVLATRRLQRYEVGEAG